MEKSTHGYEKVELFQSLMKQGDKYIAVLSDTSMDRDGEMVGEQAFKKLKKDNGYVAILIDHENKIDNLIGEWVNRKVKSIGGHTALIAEPKFYESNPKAQMIKGMLDEGAKCGISIGAMVKSSEIITVDGQDVLMYTELELLEASFVAIPSNRHGQAMAVAKKYDRAMKMAKLFTTKNNEKQEGENMSEENKALKSKVEELQKNFEEFKKDLENKDSKAKEELEKLSNENAELKKQIEELSKNNDKGCGSDSKKKEEDNNKEDDEKKKLLDENADLKKKLEAANKKGLNKAIFDTPDNETEEEKLKKNLENENKIPILKF